MKSLFLTTLLFLSGIASTQIEKEREIFTKLCSPEMHGRGYVNNGVNIAAKFIAKEFENAGAKPAGEDGFFQELSLDVNTFPKHADVFIKKTKLRAGVDYLVQSSTGSYNGKIKLVPIDVFKLIAKDEKEFAKLKKLKPTQASYIDLTKHESRDTIGILNSVAIELSQMNPVIVRTNEKFMWSVGRSETKFPAVLIQDSTLKKNKTLSLNIENKMVNYQTENVIAKIKGKRSDSCFVFTAHYDHLGRMGADAYFPGANDNASGTTMILSLAKHYANNQPDFDIYFIAFTGEEAGLVGSKYFVSNPTFDIQKIKFLLNLDIMGSGDLGITAVNGTILKEDFNRLVEINEEKELLKVVKPRGKTQNSDHFYFQEQGIKTFFIYTMGTNKAYHDIFDVAEGLDLNKFVDLRTLFIDFVNRYP